MKKRLAATFVAIVLGTVSSAVAQNGDEEENFHKAFNDLLHKAIEDAVNGWEDGEGKGELERLAEMLEKLLEGEGQLSDEDLEEWLGKDWLERLQESGPGFGGEIDPSDLNDFARLLAKLGGVDAPGDHEREHRSVLAEYIPVVAESRKSTARVLRDGEPIALATVVHANGYLLTKLSEVRGHSNLECEFSDGFQIGARRVDQFPTYDLALLKADVDGLKPVEWASGKRLETGTFLAAPGIEEVPVAIGVASVASRDISGADRGFLGVVLEPVTEDNAGVRIRVVVPDSPGADAGLEVGDEIKALDGDGVSNVPDFVEAIGDRKPGTEVRLGILRDGDERQLKAKLGDRRRLSHERQERLDFFNQMGGPLSENRGGYPSVLQTDLTLKPHECGGPLVNLDGKVVGINIARSGRVKSYAIPAAAIRNILGDAADGQFSAIDVKALEAEVEKARETLKALEQGIDAARTRKEELENKLKKARAKQTD